MAAAFTVLVAFLLVSRLPVYSGKNVRIRGDRVLPVILPDLLANLARNPRALWRVGQLARRADLTRELEQLKARELPVVVLWSARDGVIPKPSFDALSEVVAQVRAGAIDCATVRGAPAADRSSTVRPRTAGGTTP